MNDCHGIKEFEGLIANYEVWSVTVSNGGGLQRIDWQPQANVENAGG